MPEVKENFLIEFTDRGLSVRNAAGAELFFTPVEALMLLDILKHETPRLRRLADEACPLPMTIRFQGEPDEG